MDNPGIVSIRACTLLIVYVCAYVSATQTEQQTPVLATDEKYRDLFPLTKDNFTSKLLSSKDPWIVIFHNGSVELQWKTMATHLRGICWVGIVDTRIETELLNLLNFDVEQDTVRVYPFGVKDTKGRKWINVKTPNDARSAAVASLPDRTIRLQSHAVNDFYMDALMSKPARFPAYYISDEEGTSTLLKATAVRFEKYFHFGRLVRPLSKDLKELGLGETFIEPPALFVIVFQGKTMQDVNAIQFKTQQNGVMNYPNVMRFLFAINSEFRHQLPGDNMANSKQEAEMTDIITLEEDRFDFLSRKTSLGKKTTGDREDIPFDSKIRDSNELIREDL